MQNAPATPARTILVTLSVEVPATDERTPDEIALAVVNAYDVGSDDESVADLHVEVNVDHLPRVGSTRTPLVLHSRESGGSFWIAQRSGYFISGNEQAVTLWKSNRPYGVNDRLHTFDHEPTLEEVDTVLAGS